MNQFKSNNLFIQRLRMIAVLKLIIVWIFVATLLDTAGGSYSSKLYPFGKDVGDLHLPKKDDVISDMISTPPFTFFGSNVSALYVHENGLISFGSTLEDQTPAKFPLSNKAHAAAPYWADVLTKRGGTIWYRQTNDVMIISRATRDVIRAFPRYTGFTATWAVIVTWNEVTFYGASVTAKINNTFQVLTTSDGVMSFVGFIYDKLTWTSGTMNGADKNGLGGDPAQVGFSFGYSYHKLPVSGTNDVLNLVKTSNCGQPGVWFFRVDNVKRIDEKRCERKGTVSIHSSGGKGHSGTNILISGLCYRPGADVLCEFGEASTVIGQRINETKAVCSVPLTNTRKQVTLFVYSSQDVKSKIAQAFDIEPIQDTYVHRENPRIWTSGNRVNISWDPRELAADQSLTVEIVNVVDDQGGKTAVHSNITVVSKQPNTGKAVFDLPRMGHFRKYQHATPMLQSIIVRSLQNNTHHQYVPKGWIVSDFFHLANHILANESCSDWIKLKENTEGYDRLIPCPKTLRQMNADMGRFTVCELCDTQIVALCKTYYKNVKICYITKHSSDRGLQRKCCYDNNGELTAGPVSGITKQNKYPDPPDISAFSLFWNDVVPYKQCCMFSDNCYKYQELVTSGSQYIPPNIGASFGDPHILTFDNVEYTFNGFGEYTVLRVDNSQFILQGRMQPIKGAHNGKSPATVFTAFAIKGQGSSTIEARQNEHQSIDVLIDGIPTVIQYGHELQSERVFIRNSSRENYTRIILAFHSGITVYVESAAAVLQMAVALPVEFKGKTSGLLGFWDDNSDKEYLLPNNVFLNTASTMSEVHHNFGQHWATKENDSLFTYGPGESHRMFFDTSYVPTFMEGFSPVIIKMNEDTRKRALMICEQSFQCIFDIAVTGRTHVGKATKEFQEWLTSMKRSFHDEGCSVKLSLLRGSVQTNVSEDVVTHYFRCNEGYSMAGKDKISCRGGIWDESKPTCYQAVRPCKPLKITFPNGYVHGHDEENMPGHRYKFVCDPPLTLIGKEEIVCGEDGLWSGNVPFCQIRNCSEVSIKNAQVLVENEGKLLVRCNEGYTLIGPSVISCLPSGVLNESLPSCAIEHFMKDPADETGIPRLVIVIGVVVFAIVIIVVVLTICLVRKHRSRKDAEKQKKLADAQKEVSI